MPTDKRDIRPGHIYLIDGRASAQFAGGRGFRYRVIRRDDVATYDGYTWLEGYVLDQRGNADERRRIYVQYRHLQPENPQPKPARGVARVEHASGGPR